MSDYSNNSPAPPAKKAQTESLAVAGGRLAKITHPGIISDTIFSFITVNDVTSLGMTSKFFQKTIKERRCRSSPYCVIRQDRLPIKFMYHMGLSSAEAHVEQRQPFRLLVRTGSHNMPVVQVRLKVLRSAWFEQQNNLDQSSGGRAGDGTHAGIIVEMKAKNSEASFHHENEWKNWEGCGCDEEDTCYICNGGYLVNIPNRQTKSDWLEGLDGDLSKKDFDRFFEERKEEKALYLRIFMAVLLEAAKAVSSFRDGNYYPSAGCIMSTLPEILHPFYPAGFDFRSDLTRTNQQQPRLEVSYRPAKTWIDWCFKFPVSDEPYEVDPYELFPWYRPGCWDGDGGGSEYEYYFRGVYCFRRQKGSTERGQLVLVQRERSRFRAAPTDQELREEYGVCPSEAMFIDEHYADYAKLDQLIIERQGGGRI